MVEVVDCSGSLDEERELQIMGEWSTKAGEEVVEIASFHEFKNQPNFLVINDTSTMNLANVLESERCHCI
jgi:hypothetical protein